PDVVLGIDEDSVLGGKPLIAFARAGLVWTSLIWITPGLEKFSVLIEFEYRGCWNTALRLGRIERGGFLAIGNGCGPMKYPEIIVGVDCDAADLPVDPLVRQGLRPERIGLEQRNRGSARLGS